MITGEWHRIIATRVKNGCERKAALPSGEFASQQARKMSLRDGVLFMAYYCVDCGAWHVGHERDERKRYIRIERKVPPNGRQPALKAGAP